MRARVYPQRACVRAPAKERAGFVERPWQGQFSDCRQVRGRCIPFAGEVGWVLGGKAFVTWRGALVSWKPV